MKGLGICEWSLPYRGEELFDWMSRNGVDNISVGFDYDACQTEKEQVIKILQFACRLGEQYQIQIGYECPLDLQDLQKKRAVHYPRSQILAG